MPLLKKCYRVLFMWNSLNPSSMNVSPPSSQSSQSRMNTRRWSVLAAHPRGLSVLFFTELWERFSYYGMRAILILYMVAPSAEGGLGFSTKHAAAIYGAYTMWVYLLALPGGFVADRFLGTKRAVVLGGSIITLGHCALAFPKIPFFFAGLVLITLGTGLLKPSVSALVGELYAADDTRRDAGFALFFMGINIGAAFAPFVCGFLAQHPLFKEFLGICGMNPAHSWHWGFAAAGCGMVLGLTQFLASQQHLPKQLPEYSPEQLPSHRSQRPSQEHSHAPSKLTREEWRHIQVIFILFIFTIIFGLVSEQAGSSMNLFAARLTRTEILGWHFPSSWFQAAVPLYVIFLSPILSHLWLFLGEKQPSSPAKFAMSLVCVGLAFSVMVLASLAAHEGGLVHPAWLLGAFFLQEIGAVLLNPTGLSVVTKLSPRHLTGRMMGVWFLASALASLIAGYLAGFFDENNTLFLAQYFGALAALVLCAAAVLFALTPKLRRMMGSIR